MSFKDRVRRFFQTESGTFVSYSDGNRGETGTYTVSPQEAAIRGARPKKRRTPPK